MSLPEIQSKLNYVFQDVFDDPTIHLTPDTTAKDIDGWDSFAHINLVLTIEQEFKIKFATAEIESLQNVGHLTDVIQAKLNRR
jgi:acyl carrier protein